MVNLVKHKISDARSAENIYLNRLVVFVEGPSDVEIFIRLFPNREDEIRFLTPNDQTSGLDGSGRGGCIAVIKRVAQERLDRSNPDRCIGIVDRDVYFNRKEWNILFETDDDKYRNECTLGEGIKPLIYWEIENYLLDPEVVSIVLSDLEKYVDDIENTISRSVIERSIYISAANCVIHEHDIESISHGLLLKKCSDEDFSILIEELIKNRLTDEHEINRIGDFVRRYENFNKGYPPKQYLERSMRVAPGKAFISFIRNKYKVREGLTLLLAKQTWLSGKIHDHLIEDIGVNSTSESPGRSVAYPPDR